MLTLLFAYILCLCCIPLRDMSQGALNAQIWGEPATPETSGNQPRMNCCNMYVQSKRISSKIQSYLGGEEEVELLLP